MHLKKGNNYIWLLPVAPALCMLVVCILLIMFGPPIGIQYAKHIVFGMPLIVASGIVLAELRSGIALNEWWTAEHEKGQPEFSAAITTHIIKSIMMLGVYIMLVMLIK